MTTVLVAARRGATRARLEGIVGGARGLRLVVAPPALPLDRQIRTNSAWRAFPSGPPSPKPAEMTTSARTPSMAAPPSGRLAALARALGHHLQEDVLQVGRTDLQVLDLAARDVVMAVSAFALARLAQVHEPAQRGQAREHATPAGAHA